MKNQSFEHNKKHLIDSYISIPTKLTINLDIRACFMSGTANNEVYYKNLKELDRKNAYFSLRESIEEKDYYYSKFEDPNKENLLTYDMLDMTPNEFEDISISSLSIDILNFIYFEYFLSKQVKNFMEQFNSLLDTFLKTKANQLILLEDEFEKIKAIQKSPLNDDISIESINYDHFYALIADTHEEVSLFVESKIKHIRANNKTSSLMSNETRERNLLEIIDKANLKLFYNLENWLINECYLDKENHTWINTGGKSSFSRLYLKLEKLNIIKKGGGKKRKYKVRWLSDMYKIYGVTDYDYTPKNCAKADLKVPCEFKDLDHLKSQFDCNSKNN